MRKIIIILVSILFNFSFAQSNKEILDVRGEREKIYIQFQKNKSELYEKYISKYPAVFKKQSKAEKKVYDSSVNLDYIKYKEELRLSEIKKIERLKQLLKKLNDQYPLIGKKMPYLKEDPKEVERINKLRDNVDFLGVEFLGIPEVQRGTYETLNKDKEKIGQDFSNYFKSIPLKELSEIPLSAKVYFVMDTDGYLKKIKPLGGDEEFSYLCAILLYEMNKKYFNYILITEYILPIKNISE